MAEAARTQRATALLAPITDRRRHQRVKVNLLGRFMLSNKREFACQVFNMSPGGAALIAPVQGEVGERVVAYIDHIGRIEGHVARLLEGGFAMTIDAPLRKRDKLAAQLTWLANRHVLNLPEDRRHERYVPKHAHAKLVLPTGKEVNCRIVDVSLSGAAVIVSERPPVGSPVVLGPIRGRVVRHFEDGIAIEFAAVQAQDTLAAHFG
ncbi:PilZ domain-containing protein [Prosthecomicrobium sp. N25]|uniref:PilZ domain-containing protein n=1 Tax=Prosthecomicrobium sp. N25 TaxID=3129254 RepID=UPI00307769C6